MPPIRDNDMSFEDDEDDDGMPPLVENPNSSMTFTFFTDMTPITFSSTKPANFEVLPETSVVTSPPASPLFTGEVPATPPGITRVSHGKKRDASYIPRPPNAFILFRSSFIKSQQVPGKVEGNHSTLSKIIGMYWKTLPREEREQWEAKAVIAQAEHRKKYPDWRFRPGANAMAKLKVKDGTTKKRHTHARKAKEEHEEHEKNKDQRCAKIADLLVEGKKGPALEAAVKEWEGHRVRSPGKEEAVDHNPTNHFEIGSGGRDRKPSEIRGHFTGTQRDGVIIGEGNVDDANEESSSQYDSLSNDEMEDNNKTRSKTPDPLSDSRFKVPLTSMFRRSLSAPASHGRCPFPEIFSTSSGLATHVRRDTVSIPITDISILHLLLAQQKQHEATTSLDDNRESLTSSRLLCPEACSTRSSDPFAHRFLDATIPFAFSPTSTLSSNVTGASSPTSLGELYTGNLPPTNISLAGEDSPGKQSESNSEMGIAYSMHKYQPQRYSSYSSLMDWDRERSSKSISSGARGLPLIPSSFTSSFTVSNPTEDWNEAVAAGESTADTNLSTHIQTFDDAFPWYGPDDENQTDSGPIAHQFSGRLDTPHVKGQNTTTIESGNVPNNYTFYPTNIT